MNHQTMNTSEFEKFEDMPSLTAQGMKFIIYPIFRDEIEKCNIVPFMEFWDFYRIAYAGRLRDLFAKIHFMVDGYDSDPRPLTEIPEVRKYFQTLGPQWPYFFYAAAIESDFLYIVVQCATKNVRMIRNDSSPSEAIMVTKTDEMNAVCQMFSDGLLKACEMARHTQAEYDGRLDAVRKHLLSFQRPRP
jgi:hypothetical protein